MWYVGVPTSPPCGEEGLVDELGSELIPGVLERCGVGLLETCGFHVAAGQMIRSNVAAAGYWRLGAWVAGQ